MTENEAFVTATHLLEYLFCPRFTYFEYVLDIPEHQEKRFKVRKGREIHEKVRQMNPNYLRKKLGVTRKKSDIYLSGPRGMRGIVDEVLFLEDHSAAPLDYKYAEYKQTVYKTHRLQLAFYACLIKHNYDLPVNRGYLIYTRSKNKLIEVELDKRTYDSLDASLDELLGIIQGCRYPNTTSNKQRCSDCCYRNICEQEI